MIVFSNHFFLLFQIIENVPLAKVLPPVSGLQDTPASSECRQLCSPHGLFGHWSRVSSFPVQRTSSSHMRLGALPKYALPHALATPLPRKVFLQKNYNIIPVKQRKKQMQRRTVVSCVPLPQSELSTNHLGIAVVPLVVTYGAPVSSMEDLNGAFCVRPASKQSHW